MKKTHITYLLLVEVFGLVMFDQLHTLAILMSLVFLWSLVIYILFGHRFCHKMHVWICLDMSDTVILYLDVWSVSNGIIGDQQSILSINKKRSLCNRTATCNIFCTDMSATTFGF
jgi:hypothetical protein